MCCTSSGSFSQRAICASSARSEKERFLPLSSISSLLMAAASFSATSTLSFARTTGPRFAECSCHKGELITSGQSSNILIIRLALGGKCPSEESREISHADCVPASYRCATDAFLGSTVGRELLALAMVSRALMPSLPIGDPGEIVPTAFYRWVDSPRSVVWHV